jgi:bifunctional non-homologous end joining protein LigD
MLDGEAVALNKEGAPDFGALQAALSDGNSRDLIFFAFDVLFAEGEDLRPVPLSERKTRLKELLAGLKDKRQQIRYVDHFETDGNSVLESASRMGFEGIISKELRASYRSERAGSWLKIKSRTGQEVIIGGWTQEGAKLRSLIAGVHRGKKLVPVGRVGTGFSERVMREVLPRLKAVESDKSPFATGTSPRKEANMHWARPELVAEIEFAGWTDDGNVRQAAFKGLRSDKPAGEIKAERPAKAETTRMTKPAPQASQKTAGKVSGPAVVMGVAISHPDKALWPDEKPPITKLELAHYYEAVGDWMIEHLEGRPCSVVRTPDGIAGQTFFQRHAMAGGSDLLTEVKVSGDKKPYLQIDRIQALAAVAQMGGTELHPWNNQPGEPGLPGRLVFDLDPAPNVKFDEVITGALEIAKRLEKLCLVPFCKTTGGKGLHVVTPLTSDRKSPDWEAAKIFAREICRRIAAKEPERYVLNMAKKERGGRIFLDYLRNDRTSTAVAVLSPRARAGAPVSMPLTWAQVRAGLDPKRYTLRTVPTLMTKSDPWADFDRAAKPFAAAAKKLKH